jgi:hypothetical protein
VWAAWHEAKRRGAIPSDDRVPYRALRGVAVRDGLIDEDDLVDRDSETGEVVADADAHDGDTYRALPSGEYDEVLNHIEDAYGVDTGRDRVGGTDTDTEDDEEYRRDPREIAATVDPRRAWDAAGRVEPEEVEGLDAFACPDCGEGVDVVRAVAIAEGLVDSCEVPLDDAYVEAFALARDEYEAPLPRYLTTADAVAEFDAVLDLISEVTFDDLDADALRSAVTAEGDAVGGDAVQALNPAWRESESEASVLVFPSGTVWDADTERVLDALRFVALDAGMIDAPGDALEGETFVDAYALARGEYGAPLPRWEPAVDADHAVTPQLPPSEDLVDDPDAVAVDTDALDDARGRVETLVREAGADADTPTVITAPPATGKTTATVKHAAGAVDGRDATPTAYLAPRKELQQQAVEKADRWGASSMILPVFAEARVEGEVLDRAVAHVRDHGKGRLRDMFGVHADVVGEDEDVFVDPDEDEDTVDLDRETCPTAEGDHGAAWGLVVHAARALGYTPRQIHKSAKGLFGTDLPCSDGGECPYSAAWDRASDPDAPLDLLVGSYGHANVQSVLTYAERGAGSGDVRRRPRAVVVDEYLGEAFSREFGEDAFDHATWLARSLRDGVEDRRDMFEHDWTGDEWASAWFAGEADEVDAVAAAARELERERARLDAIANAEEIRDEVDADLLRDLGVEAALADLTAGEDARRVLGDLTSAVEAANPEHGAYGIIRWVESAVVDELHGRPATGEIDTAALPVGGDLAALLDEAREAVAEGADYARAVVDAAERALRGGEDGVEALATWGDDGYAHPDAHHFLQAVAAPADAVDRVATDGFAFDPDATDGTRLDRVQTGERATTLLDRNGHGAILHTPPSRTSGSGDPAPLIGLDATGRAELWGVALGEDVETRGLFDTPGDRARFLRDALGLQVVQCADRPRPYEGSPDGKDLTGDVALLEAIEDGFAGVQAARERGGEPTPVGSPAVITTRTVRHELEDDEAAADVTSRWENYGNLTGANDLGEHRLAAILGSQHYGDRAVERLAALAGEEADTSRGGGRGAALDYGSDIANAYLGHMREDQVVQAALRFARGGSGATVFARTSALPDDLPVVGRGQVVETYSETAREIARAWRRLDGEFTRADVEDAVDVSRRQVRRVLAELADAGYLRRVREAEGRATVFDGTATPGAGEVDLPDAQPADPGHDASNEYYTWNVRVRAVDAPRTAPSSGIAPGHDAPPAPTEGSAAAGPPG